MKIGFAFAALAFGAVTALSSSGVAEEKLEGKIGVTAKLDATTKKATIVLKGTDDKTYVNTEYGTKCSVTIAAGGKLEKAELTKSDATFEASGKEGKAKSATFKVGADKAIEGKCKVVACTDNSCSSPFEVSFKSQ
ncbi:MAG: hypothetical protein JNK04_23885 [Myxococcales bacterium]|nr:hypothetical protein [Myxococcales bacterium]